MCTDADGAAEVTKVASRERLEVEREKRATCVKPCVAKRRAMCEPIIGPDPTIKMGPGGAMGRVHESKMEGQCKRI